MKLYGLIGYPLGHSFSKKYFTQKFEKELLNCRFENFAIENIELLPAVLQNNPSLLGLCVTIPYKEKVIPFLHELSPGVQQIGACNSIRISNGRLTGFNTDTIGFKQSLMRQLQPYHTRALVLGTGGASRAVEYVLQQLGIDYTLVSRSPKQGAISYSMLNAAIIKSNLLIINASPVGTFPDVNKCPDIPYEAIGDRHFLFDLIYNPEKTLFLEKGAERGAAVQNGYDMLIAQAEASWELWNE
ncbi:shikimate dehydrogenase [Agriterribacter sp.]|uniref:shikimate dehydrogenase family protein n=1 Tax=Agriterribacter sp. TaxID=2821509 RepID=UPI002B964EC8|nr:shikimate dehydrogenase [Agriterribacter sp.]HRO44750.1 shikimate dehydrogenase [Agriterribacter sp.]HRQ16423.1 shikimate dehydrogenase [Agriterribacter sp.]